MKNLLFLLLGAFLCTSVLGNELWSDAFDFDGSQITETPFTLLASDKIFYSSALADGEPTSLELLAQDKTKPLLIAPLFSDDSGTRVQGTATWNYYVDPYKEYPSGDVYELKETIVSSQGTTVLTRNVMIVPEPAVLLLLALFGSLFLLRKQRVLLLVLFVVASVGAYAEATVFSVSCHQAWPFLRSVVIDYTLTTDSGSTLPAFNVGFYGTLDNGETVFDLSNKGTLTKEGVGGAVFGAGAHTTIWTPDESFYSVNQKIKIKVTATEVSDTTYMVVDLNTYEVSYSSTGPDLSNDTCRKTELWLRKIEPGTFYMGSPNDELGRDPSSGAEIRHSVTLTKPYYIGVLETTQKQYQLVTGSNPADLNIGEPYPVEQVSYDMIRGTNLGANWPASGDVDATSFMGLMRVKTGLTFDLPTEAQWEYACRATTTTALNSGKNLTSTTVCANVAEVGRYTHNTNDGKGNNFVTGGQYLVNSWGLYDMHGNLDELCLDYYDGYTSTAQTDPVGPTTGTERLIRGGSWKDNASECRSARRIPVDSNYHAQHVGFRVIVRP